MLGQTKRGQGSAALKELRACMPKLGALTTFVVCKPLHTDQKGNDRNS